MFPVYTRLWQQWSWGSVCVWGVGGFLAFSACNRAVILTVCKPFEHCLNTSQPPLHPTHAKEPNITRKLPPIDPPSPPASECSYKGRQQGEFDDDTHQYKYIIRCTVTSPACCECESAEPPQEPFFFFSFSCSQRR